MSNKSDYEFTRGDFISKHESRNHEIDAIIEFVRENDLKILDLSKFILRIVPEGIFTLKNLEELILNKFANLTDDKKLSFYHQKFLNVLPSKLLDLPKLKSLHINLGNSSDDNIQENNMSVLKRLTYLKKLTIVGGGEYFTLKTIQHYTDLNSLTVINANSKSLNLSNIPNPEKLTDLNIIGCEVLPGFDFSIMKNLIRLDISDCQISSFKLKNKLKKLTYLNLSSNSLIGIDSFIEKTENLIELEASDNKIINTNKISVLKSLEYLDLSNNKIVELNTFENLKNLLYLDISFNSVRQLSELNNLSKLNFVNIAGNKVNKIDKEFYTKFYSLKVFTENINKLNFIRTQKNITVKLQHYEYAATLRDVEKLIEKKVEIDLSDTNFNLKFLHGGFLRSQLGSNELMKPPIEIINKGEDRILSFYEDGEEQGFDYLYEAKMLILGEGGAGKTSLALKLLNVDNELPKEEETTRGIDIQTLSFKTPNHNDFKINIWDFGGQEIYHSTHQFFLTKRSIYILVDDTKKDHKTINDTVFKYWLQIVELFGGNSPLLIVQNKKGGRSKDIDFNSMKKQFGFIKEKYEINLLTSNGLDKLKTDIKHYVQKLPHVGQELPKQWIQIRSALLNESKSYPYINLKDYFELCKTFGVKDKAKALELSDYLHDLGTFLHFQNDSLLKKLIILKNDWATDAVYRVFDNDEIKKLLGFFDKSNLNKLWHESYYENMHDELLALMLKFELCYELSHKPENYLIPQLLPESQPVKFEWGYSENIIMVFIYPFLPKGILSRLIVRLNKYVTDLDNIWKNGVVFKKGKSQAYVYEKYAKNEIVINVKGSNQRELMTIIHENLDNINSLYNLSPEKETPCNCDKCSKNNDPHLFKYYSILKRLEDDIPTIECDKSYKDIPVKSLIENLFGSKGDTVNISPEYNHTSQVNLFYGEVKQVVGLSESTKELPKTNSSILKRELWWVRRLIASTFLGILAAIGCAWFSLFHPFSGFYIVFSLSALFLLYKGDPKWRYFRLARYSLFSALGLIIIKLGFEMIFEKKLENGYFKIALNWISEFDWIISIFLILLTAFLAYLDLSKNKKND